MRPGTDVGAPRECSDVAVESLLVRRHACVATPKHPQQGGPPWTNTSESTFTVQVVRSRWSMRTASEWVCTSWLPTARKSWSVLLRSQGRRCFEEGTQSGWLYEVLEPHAAEVVVAGVVPPMAPDRGETPLQHLTPLRVMVDSWRADSGGTTPFLTTPEEDRSRGISAAQGRGIPVVRVMGPRLAKVMGPGDGHRRTEGSHATDRPRGRARRAPAGARRECWRHRRRVRLKPFLARAIKSLGRVPRRERLTEKEQVMRNQSLRFVIHGGSVA